MSATANGDISISLYKVLVGADGVIVEVEFLLYLVADASASMSFITGLNLTVSLRILCELAGLTINPSLTNLLRS